jgi:hypothetical protein
MARKKSSGSINESVPAEPVDAIALLKADHRVVDALFDEFDKARRSDTKARLVAQICTELKIHAMIEEELFYPIVRPKIDPDIVDEGVVEHDGAKVLINDLSAAKPTDPFYDSKVKVLAEDIRHHVQEEERWLRGMFAQARFQPPSSRQSKLEHRDNHSTACGRCPIPSRERCIFYGKIPESYETGCASL